MSMIRRSDPISKIHREPQTLETDHFDLIPDSILLLVLNKIGDAKALGRCSILSKRFYSLIPQVENVVVSVDNEIEQVLKNFDEIRSLRIELPIGEVVVDDDGVFLTWRAEFGSKLENCAILGASSVIPAKESQLPVTPGEAAAAAEEDDGSIPESFYKNGGLKLRVAWTISSLMAALERHYSLQPIIRERETLESVVLTDSDGQGVLSMNREQLDELRVKLLSASSASKRTLVPALNMRLWYAPTLELPDGSVLKGASLVAIRPNESKNEDCDVSWVSSAFDEPYGVAAKMLVKRKTYCLEMNSFG
ncbi:unnamed protein product [Cochlearia groenlandica]